MTESESESESVTLANGTRIVAHDDPDGRVTIKIVKAAPLVLEQLYQTGDKGDVRVVLTPKR